MVEAILTSAADFVAVTGGHRFENLAPRRAAVSAVVSPVHDPADNFVQSGWAARAPQHRFHWKRQHRSDRPTVDDQQAPENARRTAL